jgi:hypothetical protein
VFVFASMIPKTFPTGSSASASQPTFGIAIFGTQNPSTALFDFADRLIERRNGDRVKRARVLSFSQLRHASVDSQLIIRPGCDQAVFKRAAFALLEFPSEDFPVERLHCFGLVGIDFKMVNA